MSTTKKEYTKYSVRNPEKIPREYSKPNLPPTPDWRLEIYDRSREHYEELKKENEGISSRFWAKVKKDTDSVNESHTCMWCGNDFPSSGERDTHEDKCADE